MSVKFETVKSLNVGGMKMIPVKTEDGKQLFVKTDNFIIIIIIIVIFLQEATITNTWFS